MRLRRSAAVVLAAVLLLTGVPACSPEPIVVIPSVTRSVGVAPLVVGTPAAPDGTNPTEGALLAHVYAAALNAAGVNAVVSPADPADGTLLDKLEAGTVDIAPGYSRVLLAAAAAKGSTAVPDAATTAQVLDALKKELPQSLAVLDAAKAEDSDSIAVTTVTAEKYQLKTIADLAKVCDKLAFGGSAEFRLAERGLSALGSDYNCVPKSYVQLPNTKNELLLALIRDDVQVADIHSSSPAIPDNALVVLTDPKHLFLPQNVVPVVLAAKVPADVQGVLNKVSGALSTDELVNLNRLAAGSNKTSLDAVARSWLVQKGLVKATN